MNTMFNSSTNTVSTTDRRGSDISTFDSKSSSIDVDLEKGNIQEIELAITPAKAPQTTLAADDFDNPRNWTVRKKIGVDFLLCSWVLSLTYASTAYIASIPALEEKYNMSLETSLLGVTFTVMGFAFGPCIFGPSSELFGRRKVYLVTGFLYSVFAWAGVFAPDATSLLIFRFLIGFFGSASINNVPASVSDFTTLITRTSYTALYALYAFAGPSVGPLCSSFIQVYLGYEWNLRIIAILCTVTSIGVAFVDETHGPTLYKWKMQKSSTPPPKLKFDQVLLVYKTAFKRPIVYLFTEPTVTLVCIYLSVLYGCMYGFFEVFEVVFVDIRGFSQISYGLTYVGLLLGFFFGTVLYATVGNGMYRKEALAATARGEKTSPEARLNLCYYAGILSPISLFLFAWTAPFPHIHWMWPVFAEALFSFSMLIIFSAFVPYLIDVYLVTAASSLAAGMASRALIGSLFPLFALQMYSALTVQGATSLLAGVTLLLAPIPFIFKKYGPYLRSVSRYATVA